ncbi:CBS domain-containing protein [Candidatus Sororendozoicomonas aggregata]|uniref:CBS domain-containing protein n=1 Tax=Candidatus Sororendozoicomonas aggregata TaxID=3073239 RepID=UPI002ED4FB47
MTSHIQVRDYMLYDTPVVKREMPLTKVTELLCNKNLLGVPVVDENKKLVGFISEQDCIEKLLTSSYHCDMPPVVSDVMRSEVLTLAPGDGIIELADSMKNNKPKIYPVVEGGKLLGIINRTQVLKALTENLQKCHIPV